MRNIATRRMDELPEMRTHGRGSPERNRMHWMQCGNHGRVDALPILSGTQKAEKEISESVATTKDPGGSQ